jgi:hypothetical protein
MNKQNVNKKSSQNTLKVASEKMQDWYDNQFMPFKKQKEQEKTDFKEFANIIINNTNEVKYMLANIYDSNFDKALETWNELQLKPKAKQIKLESDMLIVIDENNNNLEVNFDKLLADIVKVLGE